MNKLPETMTKVPRKRVTHGIQFWLRTGKVNPSIRGYKKIQKYLMDLERQLIEDSGGEKELTAAKEIIIRSTIRAYGVVLLSELYVSKYSILRPDNAKKGILAFQPVLERSYMNILGQIRQNLLALGLDKRQAEPSQTLAEIIAEVDRESAEKAKVETERAKAQGGPGQGEIGGPEKSDPGASGEEVSGKGKRNEDK